MQNKATDLFSSWAKKGKVPPESPELIEPDEESEV